MVNKTALYQQHLQAGGKMVDFAGWSMPIHYGSQLNEHHAVRQDAGVFDVSHMAVIEVQGRQSKDFLRYVLANDVVKLDSAGKAFGEAFGRALYSCMLNEQGGIIDDLIVYCLSENSYRLVVNASTRDKDWAWLNKHSGNFSVDLQLRTDLAMLAVQGPNARQKLIPLLPEELQDQVMQLTGFDFISHHNFLVAATGYTGEKGYEIMLPVELAENFWQKLLASGIKPCGLGARDTLRLEAGLNLYGADMDETTTPLESNLAWTVAWQPDKRLGKRTFIGQEALMALKQQGVNKKLVGLMLAEKGVLRAHQAVYQADQEVGYTTSGTFSPTLGRGIALARVAANMTDSCQIEMRGKRLTAQVVKLPFVKAK